MRACDICHRRKIRCDTTNRQRCFNCDIANIPCTFEIAREVAKKKQRMRHNLLPAPRAPLLQADSIPQSQRRSCEAGRAVTALGEKNHDADMPITWTEDDASQEQVARTVLSDFIRQEIHSQPWAVRMVYVGKSYSNLTHLVHVDKVDFKPQELHYPFPSIRPTLPWKPHKEMAFVQWHSGIACDMGVLPEHAMRDQIVEDYFAKIHPGFPVVNELEFRARYIDPTNPPPLILLQSVLLAGVHVCNHPTVAQSRSVMKVTIFRRAKALFDLHYENDRLHIVQAALLFAWHSEGADDVSANFYYWIGVACRIAFGLGIHRNVFLTAPRMPLQDQRLCRRLWWTLFQFEVLSALRHGRPLMIDLEECDQPSLTTEDFDEGRGLPNGNIAAQYCVENAKLCEILIAITKLYSPLSLRRIQSAAAFETVRGSLDSQLAGWFLQLSPQTSAVYYKPQSFWTWQLHLHYNLALLHLHRTPFLPTSSHPSSSSPVSPLFRRSADICATSASNIAKIFDAMLNSDTVFQCWFTATTAVLAAAIQMTNEIRLAHGLRDLVLALQSQGRLEALFPVMEILASSWASVEAVRRLFGRVSVQLAARSRLLLVHFSESGTEEPSHIENRARGIEAVDG